MSNGASGTDARTRATAVALTDVDITFRLAGGGTYAAVQRASLDGHAEEVRPELAPMQPPAF